MPKHDRNIENIEEDRRDIDQSIKRLKLGDSSLTFSEQLHLEESDEKNELLKMNKLLGFLHWCRSNRKQDEVPNNNLNHTMISQQAGSFQQNECFSPQMNSHLSQMQHSSLYAQTIAQATQDRAGSPVPNLPYNTPFAKQHFPNGQS